MRHISAKHYWKRGRVQTITNLRQWNGLTEEEVIDRAILAAAKVGRFERLAAKYAKEDEDD